MENKKMEKDTLKRIMAEFHESGLPDFVRRDLAVDWSALSPKLNKVITVIGPRRAGKTTYLFQMMRHLMEQGASNRDFIYVDFEDTRILPLDTTDLQYVLDAYLEMYGPEKDPVLFLDEVQNVPNWEKFVRRVNDQGLKTIVTGSTSRMLAREMASALRGRTLTYELFPFSFPEYLKSREVDPERQDVYGKGGHVIRQHFENYFFSGGFPEVALTGQSAPHTGILHRYFDTVFYRDLIDRYKIRNSALLRRWLNVLLAGIAAKISLSKMEKDCKSRGMRVSKATLSNFATYVEDIYFGFFVEIFSQSARTRQANPKKFYIVDLGLHNHLSVKFTENRGRLLENLVYLRLRREGLPTFYYRSKSGGEVDFLVKDGKRIGLIQVCHEMERMETFNRKKRALVEAMQELALETAQIVTFDSNSNLKENGQTIHIVPAWQWLLSPAVL